MVIVRWVLLIKLCVPGLCVEVDTRIVNGIAASDYIPYQASVRVSIRDLARFGRGKTFKAVEHAF